MSTLLPVLATLIIAVAIWAIVRGYDVRLALLLAALAMAGIAGDIRPIVRTFLGTFSDEKFVMPICTAMGFAYVLRITGCDQHLVRLLTHPLRKARFALIPGVICVGFLVNIPVISQTSTSVCLGPVVVPLMRAAGFSAVTIGSTILLGASIGGELLNPAAPELNTVSKGLHLEGGPREVIEKIMPLVFPHLVIATGIFWYLTHRYERHASAEPITEPAATGESGPVNIAKAIVPLLPLAMLFLTGPPWYFLRVPEQWIVEEASKSAYATRLIGLAMLIGTLAAALACPRQAPDCPRAFFEGAGYAFANVISLIVTANCFGKAIEMMGLARLIGQTVQQIPALLLPMAGLIPLAFAMLSGSGMAATQSLFGLFAGPGCSIDVDANQPDPVAVEQGKEYGAIISLAAAAGRTMSPVAAVNLMCSSLTRTSPVQLTLRVLPPLIISWVIVLTLRGLGIL